MNKEISNVKPVSEEEEKAPGIFQKIFYIIIIPLLFVIALLLIVAQFSGTNVFEKVTEWIPKAETETPTEETFQHQSKIVALEADIQEKEAQLLELQQELDEALLENQQQIDRKSTRLNSSHVRISYAVFCLKKKKKKHTLHHFDPETGSPDQLLVLSNIAKLELADYYLIVAKKDAVQTLASSLIPEPHIRLT